IKTFLIDNTAFVTIEKNEELRACMGHIFPTKPFIYELQEVAITSATNDWRFGPVTKDELPFLNYEITILSRFKKVLSFNEIKIGKHGLYLRYKNHSGLLLPQVAIERNWDVTTFLQNLCIKAGVSKTTFLDPETEIYAFEALIIH
ncbi:MAG: AmmeMemoRadiSam system protein A, partial [Candidatus Kapaibacteriota bacterium]